MTSFMKRVFDPPISYPDQLMFMTSIELNHSINAGDVSKWLSVIGNLLASENTKYNGLQLLEMALQQSSEFYKGRWVNLSATTLKDPNAVHLQKKQVCKILTIVIPYLAKDPTPDSKEEIIKDIFPLLLEKINENVEWSEEACKCVKVCLQTLPSHLVFHETLLLTVILNRASENISSKAFEVLAECFCEIPYCNRDISVNVIKDRWRDLYLRTLKTLETLQMHCLGKLNNEECPYERIELDVQEFTFQDKENYVEAYIGYVRRFNNLSKCLAKLLSSKGRYSSKVPIELTFNCLIPLYMIRRKDKGDSDEEDLLFSFLAQMQLAGLVVIESLILNCNLLKHTVCLRDLILFSLQSSGTAHCSEPVSELRISLWKLLQLWLNGFGRAVAKFIAESSEMIQEFLNDINIYPNESLQANSTLPTQKAKKNASIQASWSESILKKRNLRRTCEAALASLKSLLYTGAIDFQNGVFQEVCTKIFKVCQTIQSSSGVFPFPYNDATCRKKLYSVVLAITVVLKPDDVQSLQTAVSILTHARNDCSFKVRTLSNRAPAIYRLQLYPKRPLPVISDNKQRQPNVADDSMNYSEWATEEYDSNVKVDHLSETPEVEHVEHSFQNQNEVEIHSEEYMDADTHYPEQIVENQCNGDDILEIQTSSQCQDEESDEEEEEEDEEEDDDEEEEERNYGEEETTAEEPQQEMYIPTTRKVQISSPIQIDSEKIYTVTEPEYEELNTLAKPEEKTNKISDKNSCTNGDDTVMCDEDMPSSSHQVGATENGVFKIEEDENLNEDGEVQETESYPVDRREEINAPPPKRQKVETKEEVEEDRTPKSPTVDEMKSLIVDMLPSVQSVRSGKVTLSTS